MPARLPLISHLRADAPLAFRAGHLLDAGQFLRDVDVVAATLPQRRYLLNLCQDRYRFAVGFAAALLRGQTTLLPPARTPELLRQLQDEYSGLYCLSESAGDPPDLECVVFADDPARAEHTQGAFAPAQVAAEHIAAIAFTSGSTGRPTAHAKPWWSLVASAGAEAAALGIGAASGIGIVGTVPAQHMYGLESTLLLALHNALAFHAARPFYPDDIRRALRELAAPRMLVTTPLHLRALVESEVDLPQLALIVCATAPLAQELAQQAEARFGAPVREIYGCTETGQLAARRTVDGPQWRTLRGITLRREGELCVAEGGPIAAPAPLADVIELATPETFSLEGRLADMVNIAGKRTSLAYLNALLAAVPGVRDGVFFIPDQPAGDAGAVTRLMAFAVAPGMSAQSLLAALRQRIDPAFLPRPLHLLEALPRNASGKLPRAALCALAVRLRQQT